MFYQQIKQLDAALGTLESLLAAGNKHAESRKFDGANLLGARLAPDMFNLIRQVQAACDTAKFAAARLSDRDSPKDADTEVTLEELNARIHKTREFLSGFSENDFEGCGDKKVILPFLPKMYILGTDYLLQFVVPNFYFHVTTAYNILRHNGVGVGKQAYLGHLDFKPNA